MLGILWMTVCSVAKLITERKEYVHNREAMENRQTKYGTYYDYHAKERDAATGKLLRTTINESGDIIQKSDYKTVVRNISEEQRIEEFNRKKNDPNRKFSCYVWGPRNLHKDQPDPDIQDIWHVDYKTGDIYVVKKVTEFRGVGNEIVLECYMDIKTKKLVRITDLQERSMSRWHMSKNDVKAFIDRANRREGCIIIQPESFTGSLGVPTWEDR